MSELIILRGLPGSGKSTRAKKDFPKHLHYEPDHVFCDTNGVYRFDMQLWKEACDWVYKMVDFALARGEKVVVSDVFCTAAELEPYYQLAEAHGIAPRVITCRGTFGSIHHVPVTVYQRMKRDFEQIE